MTELKRPEIQSYCDTCEEWHSNDPDSYEGIALEECDVSDFVSKNDMDSFLSQIANEFDKTLDEWDDEVREKKQLELIKALRGDKL